jgi:hypothetical protein
MNEQANKIRERMLERGCELNSVCGFDEIEKFQSHHDIELPEEYVFYLTQVSNGGDGPPEYGIGIGKLGEVASDMSAQQKENWLELMNVQKKFPYSEALTDDEFQDEDHIKMDYGSLYVGNDGCGMYWHLIVSGPEKGNMWLLSGEGIGSTEPRLDFLSWLEYWLDDKEYW